VRPPHWQAWVRQVYGCFGMGKAMASCTRETDPTGMHGPFEMTTKDMDNAEARKWLEELLNLYDEVTKRDAVQWERTKGISLSRTDYSFC